MPINLKTLKYLLHFLVITNKWQNEKTYTKINYYYEDEIGIRGYKNIYIMANTEVEAVIKLSKYVLKELNERCNIPRL